LTNFSAKRFSFLLALLFSSCATGSSPPVEDESPSSKLSILVFFSTWAPPTYTKLNEFFPLVHMPQARFLSKRRKVSWRAFFSFPVIRLRLCMSRVGKHFTPPENFSRIHVPFFRVKVLFRGDYSPNFPWIKPGLISYWSPPAGRPSLPSPAALVRMALRQLPEVKAKVFLRDARVESSFSLFLLPRFLSGRRRIVCLTPPPFGASNALF